MIRRAIPLRVLALAIALAWCSPAAGATWTEPDVTTIAGSLVASEEGGLELPWAIVWQLGPVVPGSPLDPRSVVRLPNGNTLVTSRDSRGVFEVTPAGSVAWSYTTDDDPLLTPFHATRTPSGTTLIVDRWQETVIEVDGSGAVVWRYGVPDDPGEQADDDHLYPDPGELIDPFQAVRLPNGNTLIAENQAGRVIEVRSADYRVGEANDGYTETSIVWQYGVIGEMARDHGYAPPYLDWPKYAQRLPNGNTLITDEVTNLVIEVTPARTIAWSYGVPGVSGSGPGLLSQPASAERASDGTTFITDGKNNRVIRVSPGGDILWEFSATSLLGLDDDGLVAPRRGVLTPDGSILIADEGNDRLIELGRQTSGVGTSAPLDCGLPGVRKRFTAISLDTEVPDDTSVRVGYSIDGGPWLDLAGATLPADTFGTLIRYRVTLETSRMDVTPRLLGASLEYEAAPAQSGEEPGDGTGGSGTTGSGSGSGSSTGRSRPRPPARPPIASGSKQVGDGYARTETLQLGDTLPGSLLARRGFAMASVSTSSLSGSSLGPASPAAPLGGLALLGGIYLVGAASVPTGRLAGSFLQRLRPA